jgi:hypothetical protein
MDRRIRDRFDRADPGSLPLATGSIAAMMNVVPFPRRRRP